MSQHTVVYTESLTKGEMCQKCQYHMARDSTLPDSLLNSPRELIFKAPNTLLVADTSKEYLRPVDMTSDKVTTLKIRNALDTPSSRLLTNNSL